MENIDKIINIRVKYSDLIKGMSESAKRIDTLNDRISELKSGLKGLKAARKAGTIDKEAYNEQVAQTTQELVANREEVKALQSAMRLYSHEIQDNIKEEKNLEGSVNGLRASIRNLTAEYNALSAADREGSVGNGIAERISKMQAQVSAAEQRLGNFRSNVGNYQSAFNGLNVSVSQIVRELPSATMGANMFFLAISNNIPTLADEINKLRAANKQAMKEGKQGVPILKQLGSALFSWNSLISVGITLLTVYGKDIVNWIGNLFKGKKTIDATTFAMNQMNAAMSEGRLNAQSEVTKLNLLYNAATDLTKPYEERATAVRKLREEYPAYFGNMDTELIMTGQLKSQYDKLRASIIEVAQARAAQSLMEENEKNLLLIKSQAGAYDEYVETLDKYNAAQKEYYKMMGEITKGLSPEQRAGAYLFGVQSSEKAIYDETKSRLDDLTKIIRDGLEKAGDEGQAVWDRIQDEFDGDIRRFVESLEAANARLSTEAEKLYTTLTPDELNKNSPQNVTATPEVEAPDLPNWRAELDAWIEGVREQIAKGNVKIAGEFEKLAADIAKEADGIDMDLARRMQETFKAKEDEYNNRILSARLSGGDEAAQNETVAILREQLAEFDSYAAAYRAMGDSAIEIDNRRLEMLIRLHDEMNKGAQKEAQSMRMSFQAASDLAGALGGLAEEAGASAPVVAMLGIAQAIASMGAALSKAFSSSATVWDGIAGAVAAISTITTIISQIKSLNSTAAEEGAKYHYARGGLVTGPGTGTSDSIAARLSNGEAVMTARAVVDWGPVLSMMNVSSGGNAIPTSHLPERRAGGMREMEQMLRRVMREMPNPVVTVRDINNGQRRVKVQDETARYAGRKR